MTRPEFQVCLYRRHGKWATARLAWAVLAGRTDGLPGFEVYTASDVRIDGRAGDPVQGDGDIIARLPVRLALYPAAIRFLVPCRR